MALMLRPYLIHNMCASPSIYCVTAWLLLLPCPPPIGMGSRQSIYLKSPRMIPVVKHLLHSQRASFRGMCLIISPT
jgi:hypothetical protein